MLKRVFAVVFTLIFGYLSPSSAQDSDAGQQMEQMEDSLLTVADSMYNAFLPDERPMHCERFVKQLVRALRQPNSFSYEFARLKKKINIIGPADNSFRIFNWLVVGADNQIRYYGAIQMPSETLKLYPLVDYTKELGKFAEDSVLTGSKWFGALYYRIISTDVDGKRLYTLFGLNASGLVSNKKVMDPLQ
ncbi:MAG TPA: hypothetical protein VEB42_16060, partial [Chitinophagaceae bacterium]|nr:hypothetical protein [Chitinophagaceae bacterium]